MVFVCLALISTAIITYFTGGSTSAAHRDEKRDHARDARRRACALLASRFLHPLAFVIFNIVYWVYYTSVNHKEGDTEQS